MSRLAARRALCTGILPLALLSLPSIAGAQYVKASVGAFNTSSTSFVNVPGGAVSFTPAQTADVWVLFFSSRLRTNSTAEVSVEARYLVNGVEHGMGGIQNNAANGPGSWQHFYRVTGTTASQSVQVQLRDVTGATATMEDLRVIAFRLPANSDFQYAETEPIQFVPSGGWASYRNLTFTPTSAGSYLVFAVANGTELPGNNTVGVRLKDPSGAFWPVSDATSPRPHFANTRNPWQSFFVARAQTLTPAPQSFDLEAEGLDVTGAQVRYTRIMAFRTDAFDTVESVQDLALTTTTSTAPVVKSTLITAAPPSARDFIVIQSLVVTVDSSSVTDQRRAGFERNDVVQTSYAHTVDNLGYKPSYGFFDALTATSSFKYENTYSTSSGAFPVHARESVIHVLRLSSASCPPLQAAEGAGSLTLTVPEKFEMTFETPTAGGSIKDFYDLAEDPGKANDLAGALVGSNGPRGLHNAGMNVGGTYYNSGANTQGAKLELLEATATRARVRQESFYESSGAAILAGAKGIGDYSVYPSGRLALRWNRRTTTPISYNSEYVELLAHFKSGVPLNSWMMFSETDGTQPNPGTDDFLLAQNEVPGARTDFLHLLYTDWAAADLTGWTVSIPSERVNLYWNDTTAGTHAAGSNETWNSVTYFKPTSFVDHLDPAVTSRRSDYRMPDSLSILLGAPWNDPSENTAADHFNESEAAYLLTFDPALGLNFDIDGGATTRFSPFFKIRQWRNLADPRVVTLEGTTLVNDVDFRADVKPIARAHFAQDLSWHSTLESQAALDTSPDVGSAGASSGTVTFVPARYGNGAQIFDTSSYIHFPTAGHFNPAQGAIEFWYKTTYASDDGASHTLGGYNFNGANNWLFEKDAGNVLRFRINNLANTSEIVAPAGSYSWRADEWVHLRFEWDDTLPVAAQLKIFVNGVEPNPGGGTGADYVSAANVSANFHVGRWSPSSGSPGIYDEVHVYGGSATTPSPLALGGLASSPAEYLASAAKNFAFSFAAVNGTRQGEYLYFGSDSKFRGLNVALATPGAGTAPDLQWQYWNGALWANLESVGGFTDETMSLTVRTGTIYWTGDPFGWAPYSVNGGPDLFYVRAHLSSGDYAAQSPVESVIKTDILLFQYCGDVTFNGATFAFTVPAGVVALSSAANQTFSVGTLSATAETVTISEDPFLATITAANDLRIRIPAGFNMRFKRSVTGVTLGGNAASKVSATLLAYEDSDRTAVLNVLNDFTGGDQITVDGLELVSFTLPSPLDNLELEVGNDDVVSALDDKTIEIVPAGNAVLSSDTDQVFIMGSPPATASPLSITDGTTASVTMANDLRVRIPAGIDMLWDTTVTAVGKSGSAALKVGGTVGYEDFGKTLVVDVTADFGAGEFVTLSGLKFKTFAAISPSDNLELEVFNDDAVTDEDDKTITIAGSDTVQAFTARSTDLKVRLEWVNPSHPSYVSTLILRRGDQFPTGPLDPVAFFVTDQSSGAGNKDSFEDLLVSNDTPYFYAAYVDLGGGGPYSAAERVKARPFDNSGTLKWAYSTGATAMATPGLRVQLGATTVYTVSNDRLIHSVTGGDFGGEWPVTWKPYAMGEPAQSRPPVVGFAVGSAANGAALVGSQDGRVYVLDADVGTRVWKQPVSTMVQAAPAGHFVAYSAGAYDLVMVGTRDGTKATFEALAVANGAPVWSFTNSSLQLGDDTSMGIISGGAAIDYPNRRVYFASRQHATGSPNTIWCLDFTATGATLRWKQNIGDVDGSPMLYNSRIYVGTNAGFVYALDAESGAIEWSYNALNGPVKGFVFPQFGTSNLLFSTNGTVRSIRDDGNMATPNWQILTIPSPSVPLFIPGTNYLAVGSSDGNLYQIDANAPASMTQIVLGDGASAVGMPAFDALRSLFYVGTEAGVIYAVSYPIP